MRTMCAARAVCASTPPSESRWPLGAAPAGWPTDRPAGRPRCTRSAPRRWAHRRGTRRRAYVLGVADRRVVRHALEVIAEPLLDLGQVVRVLQIGVRERGEHVVVQRGQRLRILDLEAVLTLEVDRVNRSRGRDLLY